MGRTIKLVLFYFLYQLVFTVLVLAAALCVKVCTTGGDFEQLLGILQSGALASDPTIISLGVLFAALMMLWHLFHFHYINVDGSWLHSKGSGLVLLLCIPFVYTAMYMFNALCSSIDLPNILEDSFMDMSNNIWGILSMAVAAPILEECLFRGAIEGHLIRTWKRPWLAVVVSALVFGIIHMNPAQMLFAFLAGLVLGWLYMRTHSVLPGIVGHILNNSMAVVTMRICGTEVESLEEMAGPEIQPYFLLIYGLIFIACTVLLYKKMHPVCNFSDFQSV